MMNFPVQQKATARNEQTYRVSLLPCIAAAVNTTNWVG
jgi:hypothetical protein